MPCKLEVAQGQPRSDRHGRSQNIYALYDSAAISPLLADARLGFGCIDEFRVASRRVWALMRMNRRELSVWRGCLRTWVHQLDMACHSSHSTRCQRGGVVCRSCARGAFVGALLVALVGWCARSNRRRVGAPAGTLPRWCSRGGARAAALATRHSRSHGGAHAVTHPSSPRCETV